MRIVVLYNPISGRGLGGPAARAVGERLASRGHGVELLDVGPASPERSVEAALASADLLVVVGGDGTVHSVATAAARAGVPIYHAPFGTENLFAREFGMRREAEAVADAAERGVTRRMDLGWCNGRPFVLMCSVGFDANVVHRLARNRRGVISHRAYLPHIAGELLTPRLPPLTVTVDGRPIVDGEAGILVVGNSGRYAMRLDPARRADVADGLLDVVFLPCSGRLGVLGWMARLRLGGPGRGARYERGTDVSVESGGEPAPYQIDGEAPGAGAGGDGACGPITTPMRITIEPGALPVRAPA